MQLGAVRVSTVQRVDVSILTGPKGPVQPVARVSSSCLVHKFQSSPAPKGRCNPGLGEGGEGPQVSILTGPKGPVQPGGDWGYDGSVGVSILTGPKGPVQLEGLMEEV